MQGCYYGKPDADVPESSRSPSGPKSPSRAAITLRGAL